NNQDHSMLTAMLAVKNILGEKHDLWAVNVEEEYHEEVSEPEEAKQVMGHSERLQPTRILAGAK
ncbi:MAG TPA: FAD-dependent oxidoreductase, partial [Sphingomicrobium sp.]